MWELSTIFTWNHIHVCRTNVAKICLGFCRCRFCRLTCKFFFCRNLGTKCLSYVEIYLQVCHTPNPVSRPKCFVSNFLGRQTLKNSSHISCTFWLIQTKLRRVGDRFETLRWLDSVITHERYCIPPFFVDMFKMPAIREQDPVILWNPLNVFKTFWKLPHG